MQVESFGSVDEGSGSECYDGWNQKQDSEDEECGLTDAFKQFEAQAEKRILKLLEATDRQLYQVIQEDVEPSREDAGTEERGIPAYVYMSEQFRTRKPPQFHHWKQNFHYLEVAGARMFDGESMEHIQMVAGQGEEVTTRRDGGKHVVMLVEGDEYLREATTEFRGDYEEILASDGIMEETFEHHVDSNDDLSTEVDERRFAPQIAHMEEVLDALTIECFLSTVVPMLVSLYKTMLEEQQDTIKTLYEKRETAVNRTIEEHVDLEKKLSDSSKAH